jgi:hypothetical protein
MKFHGSRSYPFFSFFVAKTAQSLDAQSDHFCLRITVKNNNGHIPISKDIIEGNPD